MRRSLLVGLAFLFAGGLSCYDARSPLGPDAHDWRKVTTASECGPFTEADIRALVEEAFETAPSPSAVQGQLNDVFSATSQADAQAAAIKVMDFILKQFRDQHGSLKSEEKFSEFTNALMCYVGIDLQAGDINDLFIVEPKDEDQTFINNDGTAGFIVPAGGSGGTELVSVNLLEFVEGLLNTKLDVHPLLFSFQRSGTDEFPEPWIISVCPGPEVPDHVYPYLLLGKQHDGIFELLPEPDSPGVPLNCAVDEEVIAPSTVQSSRGGQRVLTDLVALNGARGPVSGSTTTFSEIVTTDRRTGASSSTATFSPQDWGVLLDAHPACASFPAGSDVPAFCRPNITLTTPEGTAMFDVPVNFVVEAGGGAVAGANPGLTPPLDCGTHGASATVPTNDPGGDATACWRLGTTFEMNRVRGTPTHGGDATDPLIEFGWFVNGVWTPKSSWAWEIEATDETPEFTFNGFFAPVKNPPAINSVKAGSSIPVKFSLGGDFGLEIFEAGYPTSTGISCNDVDLALTSALTTITSGGSALSYDGPNDQYNYTWKSEKAWGNSCREFAVKFLGDPTEYKALFNFTK